MGGSARPGLFAPISVEGADDAFEYYVNAPGGHIEGVFASWPGRGHRRLPSEEDNIRAASARSRTSHAAFNIFQRHSEFSWRTKADIVIEPDVKTF